MVNVVDSDKEDAPAKTLSTVKEPQCLVFEWRDHHLRHVPSDRFRQNLDPAQGDRQVSPVGASCC
jgi:hypothetical protein